MFFLTLPLFISYIIKCYCNRSRQEFWERGKLNSTMTYQHFTKAVSGFFDRINFDDTIWFCRDCGAEPKVLVADGKVNGPAMRKVRIIL